jgi:hypothetical protein
MSQAVQTRDAVHDFDFLRGRWRIHNRRLLKRMEGCTDWDEFEATGECQSILQGMGNIDNFVTDYWEHFEGMSARFYIPQTQEWCIYWSDTRQTGILGVPVVGSFKDGIGLFRSEETFNGKPITVRYIWSKITPTSAQWEQAFSGDGGKTWETNWIMSFTRVE